MGDRRAGWVIVEAASRRPLWERTNQTTPDGDLLVFVILWMSGMTGDRVTSKRLAGLLRSVFKKPAGLFIP